MVCIMYGYSGQYTRYSIPWGPKLHMYVNIMSCLLENCPYYHNIAGALNYRYQVFVVTVCVIAFHVYTAGLGPLHPA